MFNKVPMGKVSQLVSCTQSFRLEDQRHELLSFPGKTLTTRPRGHLPPGVSVDIMITTSPTFRLAWSLRHFFPALRLGTHSRNHLCQKWRPSSCTRRHLLLGLNATQSGAKRPPIWPWRKWLGVRVRWVG